MVVMAALVGMLASPCTAHAQDNGPRPNAIGWEVGQTVLMGGHAGELGLHFGIAQGNNVLAFRTGFLDETNSVPCSLGVMYQFVGFAGKSVRVKPTASMALGRVFSCASNNDPRRASRGVNGTGTLGGGVRLAMFRTTRIGGSLDVMGYAERMKGARADQTIKGVMVGIAIHGPW